ncbi:unnamed protein product [Linum trigynum]|uniref:Uncharacterized protein n=1 Tax=Linum trigynum TaxID=586398 RepID=A0AAV2DVE0_9ROSI
MLAELQGFCLLESRHKISIPMDAKTRSCLCHTVFLAASLILCFLLVGVEEEAFLNSVETFKAFLFLVTLPVGTAEDYGFGIVADIAPDLLQLCGNDNGEGEEIERNGLGWGGGLITV